MVCNKYKINNKHSPTNIQLNMEEGSAKNRVLMLRTNTGAL